MVVLLILRRCRRCAAFRSSHTVAQAMAHPRARFSPPASVFHPTMRQGTELLPLVWREHCADAKEHAGVGLFEFGAGLSDSVDLAENLRLVRLIGLDQRLHG